MSLKALSDCFGEPYGRFLAMDTIEKSRITEALIKEIRDLLIPRQHNHDDQIYVRVAAYLINRDRNIYGEPNWVREIRTSKGPRAATQRWIENRVKELKKEVME
jgi:hypothetical protein